MKFILLVIVLILVSWLPGILVVYDYIAIGLLLYIVEAAVAHKSFCSWIDIDNIKFKKP